MRAILTMAIAVIATTGFAQQQPSGSAQPNAATDPPVFVNGALAVPGAEPDGHTVPSKFSERNAKVDETPILAYPLALNTEQRQRIYQTVMGASAPASTVDAKVAQELPGDTQLSELPADLIKDMPALAGMSYLKTSDRVLVVRAPTMTVMDEITR
jgi:hypothetical protein